MKQLIRIITLVMLVLINSSLLAGDAVEMKSQPAMPPMGQPEQMKEFAWKVGDWDVEMQWRMSDTTDHWVSNKGVANYKYVLDGCALMMTYKSEGFMGMPFDGLLLENYNRTSGKWQSIWIDNMDASLTYYEGGMIDDAYVLVSNEVLYEGKKVTSRMTTYNMTEKKCDWKMEMSADGGKTYWVSGKATYTKK